MSIDGMISKPFSARSLDLRYQKGDNKDTVLKVSRERYGRVREEVEDKISRWTKQKYSDKGNRSHTHKNQNNNKKESSHNNSKNNNKGKKGGKNNKQNKKKNNKKNKK
jgi:hypothetical protein